MKDWRIVGHGVGLGGEWVYHTNPGFPNLHISWCVGHPRRDRVVHSTGLYYYGRIDIFNRAAPVVLQSYLRAAWDDFCRVA